MKRVLLALILFMPMWASATTDIYPFETKVQEQRFQELSYQLRCLVCQGQSIGDSNSDLAQDLKQEVHRLILEGKSDAEIIDFMVARYGEFVLYKPPVQESTYLLWFGPFLLLAVGAGVVAMIVRKRRAPAQLSAEQRAQVEALLREERH